MKEQTTTYEMQGREQCEPRQWRTIGLPHATLDEADVEMAAYDRANREVPGLGWLAFRILKVTTIKEEVEG